MRSRITTTSLLFFALNMLVATSALSQEPSNTEGEGAGIQFNGLGRTVLQQTGIGGTLLNTDSVTVENLTDGEFLLDLAVNAQPNDVTELQGVIRLRNEFGGFFGSGVSVEVRELWARGIIADAIKYRVGDMDVALTPYTLYLPDEAGVVNEPEVFRPQKEIIYYDEFYSEFNERRLQGGSVGFGLEFDRGLDELEVRSFIARLRATNFMDTPTRLIGGGRIGALSPQFGPYNSQAAIGANLAYTWDDLLSGDANTGIRNSVFTLDGDLTLLNRDQIGLHLIGEGGWSKVELRTNTDSPTEGQVPTPAEPTIEDTDTFIELGLSANLKRADLSVSATFVDVGPDFYSSAAQSQRVDYTRTKSFYDRVGNDRDVRMVTLFDLARDPALYTFRVANELMAYDPRYGNVLPYGRATPNRRGARFGAAYAPSEGPLDAAVDVSILQEIRGQGTTELKDFILIRAEANARVDQLIDWNRALEITLGAQRESTSRSGEPVERVNLTSTLVEAGVSAEVYDRLDILLGLKTRTSDGREYVPTIENFNDVEDFPGLFEVDDSESLWGLGIRYRFRDGIFLTLQYQRFSYGDDSFPAGDYQLNQVFALYSMTF